MFRDEILATRNEGLYFRLLSRQSRSLESAEKKASRTQTVPPDCRQARVLSDILISLHLFPASYAFQRSLVMKSLESSIITMSRRLGGAFYLVLLSALVSAVVGPAVTLSQT